jgi:hypothetical protein
MIAIIQIVIVALIFKFKINYRIIGKIFLFAIGVFTIGYFTKDLPYEWAINFLIMISASVLWAFITRVLNLKSIYHIIKYG